MKVHSLSFYLHAEVKDHLVKSLQEASFTWNKDVPAHVNLRYIKDPTRDDLRTVGMINAKPPNDFDDKMSFDPNEILVYDFIEDNRLRDFMLEYEYPSQKS